MGTGVRLMVIARVLGVILAAERDSLPEARHGGLDPAESGSCPTPEHRVCSRLHPDAHKCGEGFCRCCGGNRSALFPRYAECLNHGRRLTYIPRLPASVRDLDFSCNDLSGVHRANTVDFLSNATRVANLTLRYNGLARVHPDAFRRMTRLTRLDVTGNPGLTWASVRAMLAARGLQELTAEHCRLASPPRNVFNDTVSGVRVMRLAFNVPLPSLPRNVFNDTPSGVRRTRLASSVAPLSLPRNVFNETPSGVRRTRLASNVPFPSLPRNVFNETPSGVRRTRLASNVASHTYDLTAFCALSKLHTLVLADSLLTAVKTSCVLTSLESLNLERNHIGFPSFPETCADERRSLFPALRVLRLDRNKLRRMQRVCLPRLVSLNVSRNPLLKMNSHNFRFRQLRRLERLLIDDWVMVVHPLGHGVFSHPALRELSFNGNNFNFGQRHQVPSDVFANSSRLAVLSLEGNDFRGVDAARFMELFGGLPLEVLTLSNNRLGALGVKVFARFPTLVRLALSNTGLSSLPDGALDALGRLRALDLSSNHLTGVAPRTFHTDTRRRLRELSLGRNPFICTCHLQWFRDWFVSEPRLFLQPGGMQSADYQCNNLPATPLAHFRLTRHQCLLSQAGAVVVIYINSFVLVSMVIFLLVFRFRWHLRLALYEAFRGSGDVRRRRVLEAGGWDYDVFVSYAAGDLDWVRGRLLPELEGSLGLRLCVHERDFVPGHHIVDNIVDSVQSSQKVLMVFSRDFACSQWCQFELKYCLKHLQHHRHHDNLQHHRHHDDDDEEGDDAGMLIVCVDDVTSSDVMTGGMMTALTSTPYIQWAAELEDAVTAFWARLRLALCDVTHSEEGPG